jgi:undecaprenyl-diphosphatase
MCSSITTSTASASEQTVRSEALQAVQSRPVPLCDADRNVLKLLRTRGHAPRMERAVALYSRLGEHAACWLALGAAGSLWAPEPARRRAWRRGVAAVATAYAANYAVKLTVRRPRPELPELPPLAPVRSRLSFPSAHSTTSFAAARAYRGLAPAGVLYGAATLFAISRPYLGVHYPSDVLAGALLGTLVAAAWGSGARS